MYYGWSKEFLEAGKRWLAGDAARAANSDEVQDLRREAQALKEVVADLTLENRLLKKRQCHVWMSPADQGLFSALRGSWVRSCLRPFARRIGSAGPDVVR